VISLRSAGGTPFQRLRPSSAAAALFFAFFAMARKLPRLLTFPPPIRALAIEAEQAEAASCPKCSGYGVFLGYLGKYAWFRCRACAWEFNVKHEGGN
jgi:hypothetical protein